MTQARPLVRPSARILLLDEHDRLLLWRAPAVDAPFIWFTTGGALEPGETYEKAALRELWEETGLTSTQLGPWVWSRRHLFRDVALGWIDSIERYYVLRVPNAHVDISGHTQLEREWVKEHRWWSLDEIQAATTETFVPRRLGELLPPVIAGQIPNEPIDTGV